MVEGGFEEEGVKLEELSEGFGAVDEGADTHCQALSSIINCTLVIILPFSL